MPCAAMRAGAAASFLAETHFWAPTSAGEPAVGAHRHSKQHAEQKVCWPRQICCATEEHLLQSGQQNPMNSVLRQPLSVAPSSRSPTSRRRRLSYSLAAHQLRLLPTALQLLGAEAAQQLSRAMAGHWSPLGTDRPQSTHVITLIPPCKSSGSRGDASLPRKNSAKALRSAHCKSVRIYYKYSKPIQPY